MRTGYLEVQGTCNQDISVVINGVVTSSLSRAGHVMYVGYRYSYGPVMTALNLQVDGGRVQGAMMLSRPRIS